MRKLLKFPWPRRGIFMMKSSLGSKYFGISAGIVTTASLLFACSGVNIGLGGGGAPNDTRPTGTPLVQGTFSGQNGQTVSGTASVFNVSTSNYVLRLEGISAPVESGLQ